MTIHAGTLAAVIGRAARILDGGVGEGFHLVLKLAGANDSLELHSLIIEGFSSLFKPDSAYVVKI